jgi:hypothetical protein
MHLTRCENEIFRLVLLEHAPHTLYIVTSCVKRNKWSALIVARV